MNRFRLLVNELGFIHAIFYGIDRALRRASKQRARLIIYYFFAQPIPSEPSLPPRRGRSVEVNQAQAGDPALLDLPRPIQTLHNRLASGGWCFLARNQGELAGCIWIQPGPYAEDEVRSRFVPEPPAEAVWDFDVYVAPKFRLGLSFLAMWDKVNGVLHSYGYKWSMSRISAYNAASLGAHSRLRAVKIGRACYLCVGGWQLSLATVRPYVHVSLNPASTPEYRLRAPS